MKKKALIFDCDNTLWYGVLGEEEIIPDEAIQRDIIFFAEHGIIIGLCSKNNEEDVIAALKYQPLTEDYISVKRINWKDKASNLKEIVQELNIGMDAVVFIDDSEFERNLIQTQLPEIMVIEPRDLMKTIAFNFDLSGDISKTQQYRENHQRLKYQEQFTDIGAYLDSLDMVLSIKFNDILHIPRIAELTQKTNQFNLTTERYTEQSLRYQDMVYSISVKDKFGDNGITGVCIVNRWDVPHYAILSVFLLSCRILGRTIEHAFLDYVMKDLKRHGFTQVYGEYIPSAKNQQVASFYPDMGFERCSGDIDEFIYYINTSNYKDHAARNRFQYE